MNILFFGSHQYSLYPLEALYKAGYKIIGVVTQPDRPVGRHQELTKTPVKQWAIAHKIPVFTPKDKTELSNQLTIQLTNQPIDLAVLCVYGQIIPPKLLNLPKFGFLNLHPSLLPEFRGASPAQAAIILGKKETGVTIFQMDEKLDHGPIIVQEKEEIKENDTAENLYHRLFQKGAELLVKALSSTKTIPKNKDIKTGPKNRGRDFWGQFFPLEVQDDSKASYTRTLKRSDGFIPFDFIKAAMAGKNLDRKIKIDFIKDNKGNSPMLHTTCYTLHNFIRALSPWPGAWTKIRIKNYESRMTERRLKLLKSHIENKKLVLDLVQLEGGRPTIFKNLQSLIFPKA